MRLPDDAPFSVPETQVLSWSLTVTPRDLVGLAGTYSGVIILAEAERQQMREALIDVVLDHPELAGRDQIELPMRCLCWRAVRLA